MGSRRVHTYFGEEVAEMGVCCTCSFDEDHGNVVVMTFGDDQIEE